MALKARTASRALQNLTSRQREQLLHKIADNLLAKEDEIMQENEKDCRVCVPSGTECCIVNPHELFARTHVMCD